MVFLTETRDSAGRPLAVYGFAVSLDEVAGVLMRPPLEAFPLLPQAPPHRLPNDSLLAVTVMRPDGRTAIELSPRRLPDTYMSSIPGSRFLDNWTIRVRLDPAVAPGLLVGGVPPARTPLLTALVAMAVLLILATAAVAWRALELAELRAEFVASVSHELRTPLAQILLFGESLTLGTMRTRRDVRVAGGIIVGEARRLLRLVDNVLLFGREGRHPGVRMKEEALAPLVRDVVAGFAPVAAAVETRLATVRLDDVAAPVDDEAIRQVLLNLLDNAVKYGPRGQTVSLGLALADGRARLWVEDEGPGIPPGDRARVWRPFVRLARDVDRQAAGSGIGLSLVREIVTRHRGTATIEGTPAGGTRVVVELPEGRWGAEAQGREGAGGAGGTGDGSAVGVTCGS
jgi:signal transduction histidine kinase